MNLNGDEKRIQQLFRDMSRDDQRRTPPFATVLTAAHSGTARSQNRSRSLRFAMALAMLCLVMLAAMVIVLRPSRPGRPAGDDQVAVTPAQQEAPPGTAASLPGVEPVNVQPRAAIAKRVRHRRAPDSLANAMKMLSSWQSPTALLLQTPGDEMLRSLPRLGESFKTIKSFSPDQFN